jgi:hypothetical protein
MMRGYMITGFILLLPGLSLQTLASKPAFMTRMGATSVPPCRKARAASATTTRAANRSVPRRGRATRRDSTMRTDG